MLPNLPKCVTLLVILTAFGGHFSTRAQDAEVTYSPLDSESDLAIDLSEENNQDRTSERHFTLRNHPADHGLYSGRALASVQRIRNHTEIDHLEADLAEIEDKSAKNGKPIELDEEELALKTVDYAEKEWQLMFRAFDLASDSLSSAIVQELGRQTNMFSEIVSRLPQDCQRDIYHIKESALKHKFWALRMVDSMGKIPSGVTYGRFSSPGDYEECLKVRVDDLVDRGRTRNNTELLERHKFHGKYCLIDFRLPLPEKPRNKLLSIHESVLNFTGTELERQYPEFVNNYSSYASVFYEVGYMHAFCLPSTCRVEDVTKSIGKTLEGVYLIANNTIDCEEWPEEPKPFRNSQIISLILMGFVFTNALLASVAHYLLPEETGEKNQSSIDRKGGGTLREKLVTRSLKNRFYSDCFSIQKNFERLSKPDPRGLTFVHYTRIVAMALTVITHTGALGTLQAITKPADASNSEQIFRDFLPQMLANAFTSIQIFFFMAGFMLVISTYPSIKRDKGRLSFLEYAIKRAIRLMPGIAATICVNFLWPLFVEGPMLSYFVRMIVVPCEENWWHTMGFMSNFDHVEKMCLRHSYFSASDYQLHIMAFPLLILLYNHAEVALFLAGMLTLFGFIAQVIMILTKNVLPFMMVDYIDKEAFFNVVHYIHHPVWNHMSAFFYGFIIGYFVVRQIRINLSPTSIKRIWFTLLPIGILSIFAPYYWNHYKRPIYRWQMVLYVLFDRFILLSTCAWLSYASLVLSRPPPRRRQSVAATEQRKQPADGPKSEDTRPALPNVPIIIQAPPSPQEVKLQRKLATFETGSLKQDSSNGEERQMRQDSPRSLRPSLPGAALPRQRSSPNIIELQQRIGQTLAQQMSANQSGDSSNLNVRRIFRTTSGSNLATISESIVKDDGLNKGKPSGTVPAPVSSDGTKIADSRQEGKNNLPAESARKRTNPAPVSNVNTLCLILSRLTFQLYLFNMVVLWIDVNQSKYYWFFSYYFIIIKAAAVYIASALMAMVFFVVLESPSLTLYIAWVRSRAASRAIGAQEKPDSGKKAQA